MFVCRLSKELFNHLKHGPGKNGEKSFSFFNLLSLFGSLKNVKKINKIKFCTFLYMSKLL